MSSFYTEFEISIGIFPSPSVLFDVFPKIPKVQLKLFKIVALKIIGANRKLAALLDLARRSVFITMNLYTYYIISYHQNIQISRKNFYKSLQQPKQWKNSINVMNSNFNTKTYGGRNGNFLCAKIYVAQCILWNVHWWSSLSYTNVHWWSREKQPLAKSGVALLPEPNFHYGSTAKISVRERDFRFKNPDPPYLSDLRNSAKTVVVTFELWSQTLIRFWHMFSALQAV